LIKKIIAIFLLLCGISSLNLLVKDGNFTYLVLTVVFIFFGIKIFRKPKIKPILNKQQHINDNSHDKTNLKRQLPINETIPKTVEKQSNINLHNENKRVIDADFITIDFETANNNNNSACSLGLVVVKDLQIIESKYYLIHPPVMSFNAKNIEIHGILAKDVKDSPKFPDVWNEIKKYFYDNIVIAHNAQFDMSVLKCLQLEYSLDMPDFKYMDSMYISNKACGSDIKKTLDARADALGVELKDHHNAFDDATACANIVIETVKKCNNKSFQSFIKVYSSLSAKQFSDLKHQQYFGSSKNYAGFEKVKISEIETDCISADCNNPFYGKNVVFTGELSRYERKEAMQLIADLGGIIKSGVSSKTDYLIVGIQDETIVGDDGMSKKEEKAYVLIENGQDLTILDEEEFYDKLKAVVKV